ncbi:MAG: arsenate reductase ArsC [Proteobacteria bacterium]|nr:arsenate reductase ArsC [Pseudomonadota bacterium]
MAEAFARFIGPADIQYFSAGSDPLPDINPYAIKAMREVGIDISSYKPKKLDAIPMETIATVITLCDDEECPTLPDGVHHLSWPLPDPAVATGEDEELLQAFRRVRDQIRELVSRLF